MNYKEYHYTRQELIREYAAGVVGAMFLGYLFYQNVIVILLMSPLSYFYVKRRAVAKLAKRKWQLNLEFKDAIQSLSSALNAGYAIENAVKEAAKDMRILHQEESMMVKELESMVAKLSANLTMEEILEDFATRSEVDDISNFAEVFRTAKRTGGDLIKIIRLTGKVIGDKVEVKREILTLTAAKQYETKVMSMIPVGIILYMRISSPGFLDPLYGNLAGILIMTVALAAYGAAYLMAQKIVSIEL